MHPQAFVDLVSSESSISLADHEKKLYMLFFCSCVPWLVSWSLNMVVLYQITILPKSPEVCFQIQGVCTLYSSESGGYVLECHSVVLNHCNMSPKLLEVPLPHCDIRLHARRLSENWLSCSAILLYFQQFLRFPWKSTLTYIIWSTTILFFKQLRCVIVCIPMIKFQTHS